MRRKTSHNPWEWILAMLVGVCVTLICVARQVSPPTVLFRVLFAVASVAVISKMAAASLRMLATSGVRKHGMQ